MFSSIEASIYSCHDHSSSENLRTSLDFLPPELIGNISSRMPLNSQAALRQTSEYFRSAIEKHNQEKISVMAFKYGDDLGRLACIIRDKLSPFSLRKPFHVFNCLLDNIGKWWFKPKILSLAKIYRTKKEQNKSWKRIYKLAKLLPGFKKDILIEALAQATGSSELYWRLFLLKDPQTPTRALVHLMSRGGNGPTPNEQRRFSQHPNMNDEALAKLVPFVSCPGIRRNIMKHPKSGLDTFIALRNTSRDFEDTHAIEQEVQRRHNSGTLHIPHSIPFFSWGA